MEKLTYTHNDAAAKALAAFYETPPLAYVRSYGCQQNVNDGERIKGVLVDIGYFTAITMCYFLVEGFRYTHSRKQYALRLFGFGVVSQVPFSMAFAQNGILEFQDFNMMFTLFLCFCILLCIETIRNRFFARRADRTADFWFVVL